MQLDPEARDAARSGLEAMGPRREASDCGRLSVTDLVNRSILGPSLDSALAPSEASFSSAPADGQ